MKIKQTWFVMTIVCAFLYSCDTRPSEPVLHNGRVKPMDSYTRVVTELVTGKAKWNGRSSLDLIAEIEKTPQKAYDWEWIRIDYLELIRTLGLLDKKHYFSMQELLPLLPKVETLVQSAKNKRDSDTKPSKLEQKAELLYRQIRTVQALYAGKLAGVPHEAVNETKIHAEVFYNHLHPFKIAWISYLVASLFFTFKNRLGWIFFSLAVLMHTLGLGFRVFILGRPPVSNMYESMIFMNWALVIAAIVFLFFKKNLFLISVASFVSALVMIYGDLLPIDQSLDVLVPVLRSNYWLTIHVMTVVSSYGIFGLAMGLGHRHLFLEIRGKLIDAQKKESAALIYRLMQVGMLFLGIGTVLGGVWANESWGRFWGWDPKETWALITFLGYLVIVHLRNTQWLDEFKLAVGSILGFLLVLMTWYGVNFVLGRGLHSYGSGTGGMIWVVYYLIFEVAFLGWVFFKKQN